MRRKMSVAFTCCLFAAGMAALAQTAPLPICCAADFEKLEPVPVSGAALEVTRTPPAEGGPAVRVTFTKTGEERRFLALQTVPKQPLSAFKALDVGCRLSAAEGMSLRLAVLVHEIGGGAWFRSGSPLLPTAAARDLRFPLQGLRQAAFSQDASGQLEWDKVERLWVGFVADGSGAGSFEFTKLVLTSEPYQPTEPVSVVSLDPAHWRTSQDGAVKSTIKTADADGEPCLQMDFTFPGGKHMYFTPGQPAGEIEFSTYAGLRLTYNARVPKGINGLLVSVHEGGGQFYADPAPPAKGEWVTVTVPWDAFKLGSWTKHATGKLNPDAISQISFGAHGIATPPGGEGSIQLRAIDAVPAIP